MSITQRSLGGHALIQHFINDTCPLGSIEPDIGLELFEFDTIMDAKIFCLHVSDLDE